MSYIGKSPSGSGVRTRYYFTQTSGGGTSISGTDDNGKTLTYTDGEYVDVYLNGVLLVHGTDYGTGTANTISSLAALASGDVVEVVVYDIFNVAKINNEAVRKRYYKTASGSETSISGADDSGATITFPANAEIEVKLNGVALVQGTDYNTTTANTVGGLSALSAGQVVEVVVYERFVLGDTVSKADGGTFLGNVGFSGNLTADGGTIKLDGNYPTGTGNVALGNAALDDASLSGGYNTAIGNAALGANTTGQQNVAVGQNAADAVTTGNSNVAIGAHALGQTTTGSNNTAVGQNALTANTTASSNTAMGHNCLTANTTGTNNACFGRDAGERVTTGSQNTLIGDNAGENLTTTSNNTFIGRSAGSLMTTGADNTIIGRYNGNQGGLDIRTASNWLVLSDGDGTPLAYRTGNGMWQFHSSRSGGGAAETFQFKCSGSNPQGLRVQFTNAADDDNNEDFFRCIDTATTRCIITNQGDLQNHDNAYGATSDQKLKEQIIDASSQWDDIKALTVRKYKMKLDVTEKGDSDALWRLGVVAQEVEAAGMSGLITENIDRDDDGNDLGTRTKVVKYSILYMKAIKALQEAMTRIETLETENSTQATQIADLITRVTALEDA